MHPRILSTFLAAAGLLALASRPAHAAAPRFAAELFGEGVLSTPEDEFGAALTPDGQTIYFTKRTPTTNTPPLLFICVSHWKAGRWAEPSIAEFSGEFNDFGATLSRDGQRLLFASDRPRPSGGAADHHDFNIWSVERRGDGWSAPQPLPAPINTDAEELGPALAADGTLYFASTRPGGKGGLDIWRASAAGSGFGEPENVAEVNTPGTEGAPCIAADQSFLVFTATGRPDALHGGGHSYPRSDLYVTFRNGDGWGAPRHLGPPINTAAAESNASLSPDGRSLFFSSDRGFASIPMPKKIKAHAFEAALHSTRSGWSNIYRIDVRALGGPGGATR